MSYIDDIREEITTREPDLEPALLDLYALLALTQGANVDLENVHDAWAIWASRTAPGHPSIVSFADLTPEIQEFDRPYAQAIASAAEADADRQQAPGA